LAPTVYFETEAAILVRQAENLVDRLGVNVSAAEQFGTSRSALFRSVANAYERAAEARRVADVSSWAQATVDGRSGEDVLDRLWKLRGRIIEAGTSLSADVD